MKTPQRQRAAWSAAIRHGVLPCAFAQPVRAGGETDKDTWTRGPAGNAMWGTDACPRFGRDAMLCLVRKDGEFIRVDGPCVIKVIATLENRVKLGIEAERDVRIVRGELAERADANKEQTCTD